MRKIFKEILTGGDGKYSILAVMAFLTGTAFSISGILDATTEGVSVDAEFYWAAVTLVLGLIASRTVQHIAYIRNQKRRTQEHGE